MKLSQYLAMSPAKRTAYRMLGSVPWWVFAILTVGELFVAGVSVTRGAWSDAALCIFASLYWAFMAVARFHHVWEVEPDVPPCPGRV